VREQWYDLATKLNNMSMNDNTDHVIWKWSGRKQFMVKSVYQQLTKDDDGLSY
jgi:hypothetical protein